MIEHPLAAAEHAITTPVAALNGHTLLGFGLGVAAVGAAVYFGVKAFRNAYQNAVGGL
jgi:hypothetical protein